VDILFEIVKLPWLGAKVIVKIIAISGMLLPSAVHFTQPVVGVQQNQVVLQASVANACTPRIKDLLVNATPVVVEFSIFADGFSKTVRREYSYDPISRAGCIVSSEDGVVETFADTARIDSVFASLRCVLFCASEIGRFQGQKLTVRAVAYVGQQMVDIEPGNLWPDEPSLVLTLKFK